MHKYIILTVLSLVLGFSLQAQNRQSKRKIKSYIVKTRRGSSGMRALRSAADSKRLKGKKLGKNGWVKIDVDAAMPKSELSKLLNKRDFEVVESNNKVKLIKPIEGDNIADPKKQISQNKLSTKLWAILGTSRYNMGLSEAWSLTQGDQRVIVAVLDTGVDFYHPDLKNNIHINTREIPNNGIDDDKNGYIDDTVGYNFVNYNSFPFDHNGHGTHCAGTIAATNNNLGVVGVAPRVKIMPVQVLSANGSGAVASIIDGIYYAVDNGAHVINASLGMGVASRGLTEAIKYAKSKGVIFVAAAGNENNNNDVNPRFPANVQVDNVVTVGAYSQNGKRAYSRATNPQTLEPASYPFSNYGKKTVHVFAPGGQIASTIPGRFVRNQLGRPSYIAGGYGFKSGTSMAAPHVAGVVALMLSVDPSLRHNPKLLKAHLIRTSKKTKSMNGLSQSNGIVNAYNVIKSVKSSKIRFQ